MAAAERELRELSDMFQTGGGGAYLSAIPPVITPPTGEFLNTVTVTMTTVTPGAAIYYTTDGSVPDINATYYTGPFALTDSATVRAITIAPGYINSGITTVTYTVTHPQVDTPIFVIQDAANIVDNVEFTPVGDYFWSSIVVALSTPTSGATIYYTTDGSTPTTSSLVYSGALILATTTTIKAFATKPSYANSGVTSQTYTSAVASTYFIGIATDVYPYLPPAAYFELTVARYFVPGTLAPAVTVVCEAFAPLSDYVRHVLIPINLAAPTGFAEVGTTTPLLDLYGDAEGFDHIDDNGFHFKYITLTASPVAGTYRWYAVVPTPTVVSVDVLFA